MVIMTDHRRQCWFCLDFPEKIFSGKFAGFDDSQFTAAFDRERILAEPIFESPEQIEITFSQFIGLDFRAADCYQQLFKTTAVKMPGAFRIVAAGDAKLIEDRFE
jgi:hypothetical protein